MVEASAAKYTVDRLTVDGMEVIRLTDEGSQDRGFRGAFGG